MKSSTPSIYFPTTKIIIDSCQAMPVPSTNHKCQPPTVTLPPRYRAPKRHFHPSPLSRTPPQSSIPLSSPAQPVQAPSRLETEPLASLLFPSEEPSSMPMHTYRSRANQWPISPPSRMERIMLRHPSPSPRFPYHQRKAHRRLPFPFPQDLKLVTALGLVVLVIVYSLGLIQIGIAIAPKHCSHSGNGSRPSAATTQNTDGTLVGSVSQDCQRRQ